MAVTIKQADAYARFVIPIYTNTKLHELKNHISRECSAKIEVLSVHSLYDLYAFDVIDATGPIVKQIMTFAVQNLDNNGETKINGVTWGGQDEIENANLMLSALYFDRLVSKSLLEENRHRSIYIEFIVSDDFDVTQIDTNDSIWRQILNNVEQREKILKNADMKAAMREMLLAKINDYSATDYDKWLYWSNFD